MPTVRSQVPQSTPPLKHWGMILFESLSLGITTILVLVGATLFAIGLYVSVIWPLTEWEGVSIRLGAYRPTLRLAMTLIFLASSLLGFWFFSGAAWANKKMPSQKPRR